MSSIVLDDSAVHLPKLSQRLFIFQGLIFFFLMLVIPTTYQGERGILLAVLIVGSMFYALNTLNRGWRLHSKVLLWGMLSIAGSIIFMALGSVNNAPGALRVGTVYVVWPMLFLFFMGIVKRPRQLFPFLKVIVVASIGVALMALMLVADSLFGFNLGMAGMLESQGAGLGLYDGVIEYRLYNMATSIYALPFLLGVLLMPREWSTMNGRWRTVAWIALGLSVLVLVMSGRRAFWVIAALSPFVVWALLSLAGMRVKLLKWGVIGVVLGVIAIVVVVPVLNLDLLSIWSDIIAGFDFSDIDNISAYRRAEQFNALIDGWIKSPILGAGLGAAAADNVGLERQPWAYELTYVALLFQTGVAGVLVYGSAVGWLFMKGISVMRTEPESAALLIPMLSGLACFLVANATNPYLAKFDYLWTLFLPIAVLNAYMLRRST